MLRVTSPVAQVERTRVALAWASAHDVLQEKETKFRFLIPILEALPLDRARPILEETYSQNHGRPAYDPSLLFRTELARRVLRVDSRDQFATEILALDKTFRLLLGYSTDGPVPSAQTLRRFEHRICPSRKRSVHMPGEGSFGARGQLRPTPSRTPDPHAHGLGRRPPASRRGL